MKIPTTKNQREEKTHKNAMRRTARWQIGRVTTRLPPTRRNSELAPRNGANQRQDLHLQMTDEQQSSESATMRPADYTKTQVARTKNEKKIQE